METGIRGRIETVVTQKESAKTLGSGLLDVYATPAMIALMEGCASQSVAPYLDEGCGTVGTAVNIRHLAATPIGMKVYCESILTEVDGRRLLFNVKAYDETGLIGEGTHERFIINSEKFFAKVNAKKAANKWLIYEGDMEQPLPITQEKDKEYFLRIYAQNQGI